MLRWIVATCSLAFLATTASVAHADPACTSGCPPAPESWYGWQTLSLDALSFGTFVGTLEDHSHASDSSWTAWGLGGSLTVYGLGPPIVHLFHHRYVAAGLDLAVRAAAPILFALVGGGIDAAANPCYDTGDMCFAGTTGAAAGALAGYIAAVTLDAALFAREPAGSGAVDVGRSTGSRRELPVWPTVAAGPHRAVLLVGATF